MYNLEGHIRHFFSPEYVEECIFQKFTIESMNEGFEDIYNKKSAFIEVIAKKSVY